ncbi:MAG: hypothetical protein LBT46_05915 [Planctomycetaceae bacterium]|jgi:hypothetical protein|nr:hypothetical protein [Planctomycetaceae bacterium]
MSYKTALSYLTKQTATVELSNRSGGHVAVCPQWNGRIMTSCCDGFESQGFGFINVPEINRNSQNKVLCNFGGEDAWTMTPAGVSFEVENDSSDEAVLKSSITATDANGKAAQFHLSRTISLLDETDIETVFGTHIARVLEVPDVLSVGFVSHNAVRSNDDTVLSSRMRGMFNATDHTVLIVPLMQDTEESDRFPYRLDFLGSSPHHRIRHLPDKLLFIADGAKRCQLSVRYNNAAAVIGSVEFRSGLLTLWTFHIPDVPALKDETELEYVSMNTAMAAENFLRFTNYGKTFSGVTEQMKCYEINSFSAPQELFPDEELTYRQYTLHINAENEVLDEIVREVFGVTYRQVYDKINL